MDAARILVIEDEAPIRRFLRVALASQGYKLLEAKTAREGLNQAANFQPDLVILDLGLPDGDGQEIIGEIRAQSAIPILILSARGREQDKVRALDGGADDYLTKPFEVNELLARLRVLLRRAARRGDVAADFRVGALRVDLERRQVFIDNREVHLTPTEYRLLTVLAQEAGKVVTHRQLLKSVWGPGCGNESHYVRVYMGHLRQKIEPNPAVPRYLITEPGIGYRLATSG